MKKILYSVMALAISAMTFTACEDVPEPYPQPTPTNGNQQIEGAEGDGTLENPFNAIAAANAAKELGSGNVSEQMYYIKGKVVSIAVDKNGNVLNYDQGTYGNASFYISDDGTSTNQFYCYRVLYLGNKKWTAGSGDILKEGDEVIVCAKLTLYNTTPETNQNEGYLYSLNGKSEGGSTDEGTATGDGTLANPFNAVAATNAAKALGSGNVSSQAYYIKGKVASIATDKNGNVQNFDYQNYGNASFYISDDGTEKGQFYCYRVLYLGNKKWEKGAGDILKVGDEVIVCAKLTLYNTTPETNQNDGYLYSLNGKTEGSATPDPQPTGDVGSIDAPKTVADALAAINALEEGATTSAKYYIKGKVAKVATAAEDIGPNSSSGKKYKDINYYISADGSDNSTLYIYRGKNVNNTDFTSADQLKVGDEVIVYGKLQKYKNTSTNEIVPEMASGNYLVKTSNTSAGETPTTPDTPDTPAEAGTNGDFESWTGSTPDNWKTASTAGNATLSQSTTAHGGNYSCKVAGNASSNKRLGYKEMSLKAGSYKVTFYAKALSEGGSLNPGIVPINNGSAGTYAYTGYVDNISTGDWQKIEVTIEVASDGTYCFVIMNQKKSTAVDILIDDFTVVKGSTSIIK